MNGKNPKLQLDKTLHEIELLQNKLDKFQVVDDFKQEIKKETKSTFPKGNGRKFKKYFF